MADIFLSYASEDRERVRSLVDALESEGWKVWWDRELAAGPRFDEQIEAALSAARCVMVVWSEHSIRSSWCRDEAQDGLDRCILVPVRIDDVRPPLGFRSSQTASLVGWPDDGSELAGLLDGIRATLAVASAANPASQSPLRADRPDQRKSIVVLPFDNLSPDPGEAYFSDGLTEEIITHLSRVKSLRMISRSSAMAFKGTRKSIREVGEQLGVEYVLDGSVRKAGDRLRVTAELVDAGTGEQLWTERHDGRMDDVFAIQEEIAELIVSALKLELSAEEVEQLADHSIRDPKTYELWVQAVQEGRRFSEPGISNGIRLAEQVLEMTGANAHVYAFLGYLHWQAYDFGTAHQEETLDRGEMYASRALELEPTMPQALFAKGLMRYKRGDMGGFVRHTAAATRGGDESDAHGMLAFALAEIGDLEQARWHAQQAMAADPLWFIPSLASALVDLFGGRAGEARIETLDARDRLAPGEPFAGWWVAQMAAYAGDYPAAEAEAESVAGTGGGIWAEMCAVMLGALRGDHDGVIRQLEDTRLLEILKTDEMYPVFIANWLTHIGEHSAALDWLGIAIDWGFSNHEFLGRHNRFLVPLRGNARFESLLDRARERQQHLSGLAG